MNIHDQHHAIGNALQILSADGIDPIGTRTERSLGRGEIQIHGRADAIKIGAQWTVRGGGDGSYHLSHPLGNASVIVVLHLPGDRLYNRGDVVNLSSVGGAA